MYYTLPVSVFAMVPCNPEAWIDGANTRLGRGLLRLHSVSETPSLPSNSIIEMHDLARRTLMRRGMLTVLVTHTNTGDAAGYAQIGFTTHPFFAMRERPESPGDSPAIFLHELGHCLGMRHDGQPNTDNWPTSLLVEYMAWRRGHMSFWDYLKLLF